MILDGTRSRRILTRRVLLLALVPSMAGLVALAALRPVAEAQAVPASGAQAVEMIGLRDINIHHYDFRWWLPSGQILPKPVMALILPRRFQKDLYSGTNVSNLVLAFRLPPLAQGGSVTFEPSGAETYTSQAPPVPGGTEWTLSSTFPMALKTTAVAVGIATAPWSVAATSAPARTAGTDILTASGHLTLTPIKPGPGNRWSVMVQADKPKQEWRIAAVDSLGRAVSPSYSGSFRTQTRLQLTAYFDHSLPRSAVRAFRIETRPIEWHEFKNIALQPAK